MNEQTNQRMFRRTFTLADQLAFAELSGDNNPVHVNPIVARRSMFGQPIVHGVHSLMWALDRWLEGHAGSVRLQLLQVAFLKQVGLHEEVRFNLVCGQNNRVHIDLYKNDEVVVRAAFEWSAHEPHPIDQVSPDLPEQHAPLFLTKEEIQSSKGFLDLYLQPDLAGKLFPNLNRALCPTQSATLLGMTRLVGVKCPGQQSIFSELKLMANDTGDLRKIKYSVSRFDDRFSTGVVVMAVQAPGLSGTIKAFIRPPNQTQAAFLDLKKLVKGGEFSGQRALVVGGSRGLGEVTAKLLAAGGAFAQITYHNGHGDAQKVVDDILGGGGQAGLCDLDILKPPSDWANLPAFTHLYYFASPFISGSGKGNFSPSLFNAYCNYYVNGFAGVVESLQEAGLQNVFYPSTVFIDELPSNFAEYVLAKSAGEAMCRAFGKKYPTMHFYCPRLPKMATDQTVSLLPDQNPDPAPIMLAVLQGFRDSIRSHAKPATD